MGLVQRFQHQAVLRVGHFTGLFFGNGNLYVVRIVPVRHETVRRVAAAHGLSAEPVYRRDQHTVVFRIRGMNGEQHARGPRIDHTLEEYGHVEVTGRQARMQPVGQRPGTEIAGNDPFERIQKSFRSLEIQIGAELSRQRIVRACLPPARCCEPKRPVSPSPSSVAAEPAKAYRAGELPE